MSIRELKSMSFKKLVKLAHNKTETGAAYAIMLKDENAIRKIIHKIVHDADREPDIWQDAYLELNKEFKKKFVFIADNKLIAFVHKVVKRIAIKDPRREKHYIHNEEVLQKEEQDIELNEEELLIHNEEHEALVAIVNTLPPRQKEVFVKKIFEEKEDPEISEEMKIAESTVRVAFRNAMEYVKDELYRIKYS